MIIERSLSYRDVVSARMVFLGKYILQARRMLTSIRKNNRGRFEIIANILELATVRVKKTHVMYRANLSYQQTLYYFKEMQEKGLIGQHEEQGGIVYLTTEKGREYLGHFSEMLELMDNHGDAITTRYTPSSLVLSSYVDESRKIARRGSMKQL